MELKSNDDFIRTALRNEGVRKSVANICKLSPDDFWTVVLRDRYSDIEDAIFSIFINDYLDFNLQYPHPINVAAQVMSPIKVSGVKGCYLVSEDYQGIEPRFSFFPSKVEALRYARNTYKYFLSKTNLEAKGRGLLPY